MTLFTKALLRVLAAAAVVAGATALPSWTPGAGAAELASAGWWTASPLPVAPDAGEDGLVVQGSPRPDEPFSFAAVEFRLAPDESSPALVLTVAEGSASTPIAELQACRVIGTFEPASGGAMADAPDYDCEDSTTAPLDPDGTYTFFVSSFVEDDRLGVAILPTAPSDRVVFEPPDESSLEFQPDFSLPPPESDGGDGAGSPSMGAPPPETGQGVSPGRQSAPGTSAPATSASSPAPTPVPDQAPDAVADAPDQAAPALSPGSEPMRATSVTGDEGADRLAVLLVLVLTVAGSVLWFSLGRVDPAPVQATTQGAPG